MKQKYVKAFKELIAVLGGKDNIIEFGKMIILDKTSISIHLKQTDMIKAEAFLFFENVYSLFQSQGITFEYYESEKMDAFFEFLLENYSEKYTKKRIGKVRVAKKLNEEMAIPMRSPLTEDEKKVIKSVSNNNDHKFSEEQDDSFLDSQDDEE